jgi:hypothetical protein
VETNTIYTGLGANPGLFKKGLFIEKSEVGFALIWFWPMESKWKLWQEYVTDNLTKATLSI